MKSPKQVKVAFQGERGAYSESAVYRFFGPTVHPEPCKSFFDVFRSIDTSKTKYGVVPIENSIEGSINRVYDLFFQYDLKVCGEIILRIVHCLITNLKTQLNTIKVNLLTPASLGTM